MGALSAVRVRGVRKHFGDVVALDGVDLDVPAGQVHGLIGPNGAGKTTLLGLLLGLVSADAGTIEVLGHPLRRGSGVPDGVAGFVDGPGLYPWLTARQNLTAVADLRRRGRGGIDEALDQVGLTDVAGDRVRGFSLGMRQRLGLAAALVLAPRVLVLDEPANGLDPAGARHVHRVLARLAAGGTSVVLSSHRMDDLAALCGELTVLSAGHLVFSGPVAKLVAESGDLDHRVLTSDAAAARRVAGGAPGVRVVEHDLAPGPGADALVVRAGTAAVEELVARLVRAGLAVREVSPLVAPLEAAFLAVTRDADEAAGPAETAGVR